MDDCFTYQSAKFITLPNCEEVAGEDQDSRQHVGIIQISKERDKWESRQKTCQVYRVLRGTGVNIAVYISCDDGKNPANEQQVHRSKSGQGAEVERHSKNASNFEDQERGEIAYKNIRNRLA